jgi:SAM-dependent methyltransferase
MPVKLRASPNFALSQSTDGRSFVIGEVEPYPQYWLSERERLLFALCGKRGGMDMEAASEAMLRLSDAEDTEAERKRIARTIAGMREAEVLIEPAAELSRYGKEMAGDYLEHRPFPAAVAAQIAQLSGLTDQSHVLDLAAGPGSLALELARLTPHVTAMELSRGFVAAAKAEAKRRGLELATINESCNRLAQLDDSFDCITISQAIHWLDDVMLVKGVCRNLSAGGSFFVIHGALTLQPAHPLSYIIGDSTPLGDKPKAPFAEEVRALYARLALLFDALDAPDVARHDPGHARERGGRIAGSGIELFRQQRPVDQGFARAFLSDSHISSLGQDRDAFWRDLERRCDAASSELRIGTQEFAVLQFSRNGARLDAANWLPAPPTEIGYPG